MTYLWTGTSQVPKTIHAMQDWVCLNLPFKCLFPDVSAVGGKKIDVSNLDCRIGLRNEYMDRLPLVRSALRERCMAKLWKRVSVVR